MALRTRNKISTSFSMSSMTDIVFLLLIFFMITSTMIAPNALKLMLPKAGSPITQKDKSAVPMRIDHVSENTFRFYISGKRVDVDNIEAVLQQSTQNKTEPIVTLKFEKSVPVEQVVKVMSIAKNNNIKLVLAPPKN